MTIATKKIYVEIDLQNWQTSIPMKHLCKDCYLHLVYSSHHPNWQHWVLKILENHIGKFSRVNNIFFPLGYELDTPEHSGYAPAEAHFVRVKRLPQWVKDQADQQLKDVPCHYRVVGAVLWYDNHSSSSEQHMIAAAIAAATRGLVFAYRTGKISKPYAWNSEEERFVLAQQNEVQANTILHKKTYVDFDLQNWKTNFAIQHHCTDCYLHLVYATSPVDWQQQVIDKLESLHLDPFTKYEEVLFPLGYQLDFLEYPAYAPAEAHLLEVERLPEWVRQQAHQHLQNFPRGIGLVGAVLWYDNDADNRERRFMSAAIEASSHGLVFAYRTGKTREPFTWDAERQDFLAQQGEYQSNINIFLDNLPNIAFYNTYPARKEYKFYPITNKLEDYGGDY